MKRILMALLLAVLTLFAATGIGLGLIHLTDFPYTADISALDIEAKSGLSREEVLENYNAVMDYLNPFNTGEFRLPTLKYSETGAQHFADCRPIFNGIYLGAAISVAIMITLFALRCVGRSTLRYASIMTLAIPLALGMAIAIDFNGAFAVFHKLFFNGDTWLFDPAADEIITILPESFFMHCAIFIVAFWVIFAAAELIAGKYKVAKKP